MSKKVKNLITKETADRLKDIDAVAVISPRGINAIKNNQIRRKLREKGLRMTVVKNTLAKRAIGEDSKLKGFDRLVDRDRVNDRLLGGFLVTLGTSFDDLRHNPCRSFRRANQAPRLKLPLFRPVVRPCKSNAACVALPRSCGRG